MNRTRIILISLILILGSACYSIYPFNNLSVSILGEWSGRSELGNGNTTSEVQNKFLFLPFHILLIKVSTSTGEVNYDIYSYRFVAPDKISLRGRLIDELKIIREGENLIINSIHGFPPDGKYVRTKSFWVYLIWIIPIMIFLFILILAIKEWKYSKINT